MNTDSLQKLQPIFKQVLRLRVVLFLVLVALVYGFVVWRAHVLTNAQPDQSAINSQTSAAKHPQIDQATIEKINQLKDSSVNVQTLFDQARQNPFQE